MLWPHGSYWRQLQVRDQDLLSALDSQQLSWEGVRGQQTSSQLQLGSQEVLVFPFAFGLLRSFLVTAALAGPVFLPDILLRQGLGVQAGLKLVVTLLPQSPKGLGLQSCTAIPSTFSGPFCPRDLHTSFGQEHEWQVGGGGTPGTCRGS